MFVLLLFSLFTAILLGASGEKSVENKEQLNIVVNNHENRQISPD
jgi:hypothetical protein